MALDKGAQAVIFDVSDDANAAAEVSSHHWLFIYIVKPEYHIHVCGLHFCKQLREANSFSRPVVLVEAQGAEDLMGLVNKNEEANVVIEIKVEPKWVSTLIKKLRQFKQLLYKKTNFQKMKRRNFDASVLEDPRSSVVSETMSQVHIKIFFIFFYF